MEMQHNSLADDDKDYITPLLILGAVGVMVLLLLGFFMPTVSFL